MSERRAPEMTMEFRYAGFAGDRVEFHDTECEEDIALHLTERDFRLLGSPTELTVTLRPGALISGATS